MDNSQRNSRCYPVIWSLNNSFYFYEMRFYERVNIERTFLLSDCKLLAPDILFRSRYNILYLYKSLKLVSAREVGDETIASNFRSYTFQKKISMSYSILQ